MSTDSTYSVKCRLILASLRSGIAMIDDMVRDVEKGMAEAKRGEEEAQKFYEDEMNDATTKRSDGSKLIVTR